MAKKKKLTKAERKQARLRQRRIERERLTELYEDCDDRFAFIAGYTDGGAPVSYTHLDVYKRQVLIHR